MAKRKIAEKDFLESELPQTRRSQFFDIIKNNYGLLFKVGLILLGILILLIVKGFFADYSNILTLGAIKNGNLQEIEGQYWIRIIYVVSNGIDLILYPFIFVMLGGVLRVFLQLCYEEGVLFSYLFKKGIEENWLHFMIMGFFTALFKLGMNALTAYFGFNFYSIATLVFFLAVYIPIVIIFLYYSVIYRSKLIYSLRNSSYVYIKSLLPSIGFTIVLLALPVLLEFFLTGLFIKQFIYIVTVVTLLPLVILGGFLLNLEMFDRFINVTEYQELLRKGLYISGEELEKIIDRGNKIIDRRGLYEDSFIYLKEVVRKFDIKGNNITALQYKKDNVFEVIIDKEKHYLLIKDTNSESDELTKQLVLIKTNDGSDSYFNEEKNQHFYLYFYAK